MKKSRKYLAGTVGALSLAFILSVTHARMFNTPDDFVPERTSPAQLATFSDFSGLTLFGDFQVEIEQQDSYSIDYQPVTPDGSLVVTQAGAQLNISGFGNSNGAAAALVKIGMPDLENIRTTIANSVIVRGFELDSLRLILNNTRDFRLEDSTIETLTLEGTSSNSIREIGTRIGERRYDFRGYSTLIISE